MKPLECRFAARTSAGFAGKAWLLFLPCLLLMSSAQTRQAAAQSTQAQTEQQQIAKFRSDPVVMTRVYGRFFTYQHHLDNVADQLEASGKDVSGLRNSIQKSLGFSEAEYKPIRTSSDRVASEIKALDDEVKSSPETSASYSAMRDQQVNAEITVLTGQLSATNKATFEALLVRWFVPRQDLLKGVEQ